VERQIAVQDFDRLGAGNRRWGSQRDAKRAGETRKPMVPQLLPR
jgi:hypothetical protein